MMMVKKRLHEIFKEEEIFNKGRYRVFSHLTNNSKEVKKGSVFFAIKGTNTDGHIFVDDAVRKGAGLVVVQDGTVAHKLKQKYPHIGVVLTSDTRKKQAEVARRFYDYPDKKLKILAVTGTNGKTTTSDLLSQMLKLLGKKAGVIGTLNYRVGDKILGEGRTTPDSIYWFRTLYMMEKEGAEYVVAEVSSHALDQMRVYGTEFKGAVFTNLSPEHLDYHVDMENYFQAKRKLFLMTDPDIPHVVNLDNRYGKRLYEELSGIKKVYSYGFSDQSDMRIASPFFSQEHTCFSVMYRGKTEKVKTNLLGMFNVYNLTAALLLLQKLGFPLYILLEKTQLLKPVRGRLEIVYRGEFTVIVDYAHTPDALKKVLETVNTFKKGRLITVFGAGGDRDRSKRPVMGKVASENSDVVIVTSDNPRTEDPEKIISDIMEGIERKDGVYTEIDRKKAIKKAIDTAGKGDIVLIAGKGHETYQIIGDKKVYFDDRKEALKIIRQEKN